MVEDDDSVAKVLEKGFISEHHAVDLASDGQAGWQLATTFNYDLIVLDVMLPQLDGIQFCRRLRDRSYHMPVLLVTALDSSTKKIAGLDAGADDYITKPFELEELLARVRVLLRRTQTPVLSTLEWGELRLDPNSREVAYHDLCINLTPKEFCLLELFLRKPSQVFSRSAILDSLWNCSEAPGEDTVTAHIKGLRRKLADAGAPSDLIKTVYGVGYRLKVFEPPDPQLYSEPPAPDPPPDPAPDPAPEVELKAAATRKQQTRAALATLWQSVKSKHLERLEILKRITQALKTKPLPENLRQEAAQAAQAAHSLAGALGIFGLRSGSDLAKSIEQILQGGIPAHPYSQQQLSELVNALEKELEQALHQLEERQSSWVFPILLLIDNNLSLLHDLAKAIQAQGLNVQTALNEAALQALQPWLATAQQRSAEADGSSALQSQTSLPDVVLFNVGLAASDEAALERLSQLISQMTPWLVLVCSADGSLGNRVKATKLGSHSFFHNPDLSAILKGLLEMRSHLQQSANKVLVVDDDPHILEALRTLLESKGFQIVTLNQSLDFWATLQTSSPDLLLLDIEMPKFNGFELCRAVRQAPVWNQLPIIFFTAHGDASTKTAALRAGANDFIEKSLADSDLITRLCYQLKQTQLQRAIAAIANGVVSA